MCARHTHKIASTAPSETPMLRTRRTTAWNMRNMPGTPAIDLLITARQKTHQVSRLSYGGQIIPDDREMIKEGGNMEFEKAMCPCLGAMVCHELSAVMWSLHSACKEPSHGVPEEEEKKETHRKKARERDTPSLTPRERRRKGRQPDEPERGRKEERREEPPEHTKKTADAGMGKARSPARTHAHTPTHKKQTMYMSDTSIRHMCQTPRNQYEMESTKTRPPNHQRVLQTRWQKLPPPVCVRTRMMRSRLWGCVPGPGASVRPVPHDPACEQAGGAADPRSRTRRRGC